MGLCLAPAQFWRPHVEARERLAKPA